LQRRGREGGQERGETERRTRKIVESFMVKVRASLNSNPEAHTLQHSGG
jgi:hypothetical protein